MTISNIKATFNCNVDTVFDIVTNLKDYKWRSDLSNIKIIDPQTKFIEYTKDGFATTFTITKLITNKCYEFDMENVNMKGHWIGIFNYENGTTTIDFTEDVTAKKFYLKPFVKKFLNKQQTTYINDLQKAINNEY